MHPWSHWPSAEGPYHILWLSEFLSCLDSYELRVISNLRNRLLLIYLFLNVVLGFELRALSLLGRCATLEPCPQPLGIAFWYVPRLLLNLLSSSILRKKKNKKKPKNKVGPLRNWTCSFRSGQESTYSTRSSNSVIVVLVA
jgi:hypothetical protein